MEPKLLTAERFVSKDTGCSYRYVLSSTEYFRPHYHDYYEIFLVLEGNALHIVNGEKIKLQERELVFVRPFDTHDYICDSEKFYSMLNITFTSETLNELFSYLGKRFPSEELLNSPLPPSILCSESQFSHINRLMENICTINLEDIEQLKTSLRILLFEIFTRCFATRPLKESNCPEWLESLCEQMKHNGNFVYGTERMLSLCDKSREHIARSMKKYKGITPSEFINEIRLNFIAKMLINSNHSISDIIFESGFNSISYASELFKKNYGIPMREFRNTKQK